VSRALPIPLQHSKLSCYSAQSNCERACAVVAFSEPHAHSVCDGDFDRRVGDANEDGSNCLVKKRTRCVSRKSAWRNSLPKGRAAGIACHECFGTAVACAVDVSIDNKRPRIHRATITVNFGFAVNPLTVESQFQAGVGFGLTQLMAKGAITFKDGRVEQRNFDGYTPPYIIDAPAMVEVHIVPSNEPPSGYGEPPVPVISPAVANA
jgi:isoquinoline 1-oxidoreductase subunit beta